MLRSGQKVSSHSHVIIGSGQPCVFPYTLLGPSCLRDIERKEVDLGEEVKEEGDTGEYGDDTA